MWPICHKKHPVGHIGGETVPIISKKLNMFQSGQSGNSSQSPKTFILEDRELYRLFLGKWLGEQNGHQVSFFDNADALENNHEPRNFELMAAHLVPGRLHLKNKSTNHTHGVYGESLDSATILWCRKSGVKGIFDLRDNVEEWLRCLAALGNGETAETPSVAQALHNGNGKGLDLLSRRETQVARMLVKGFSAKQVAAALGTSEGTVKNQRKSVYRKLGIVRATQLAGALGLTKAR